MVPEESDFQLPESARHVVISRNPHSGTREGRARLEALARLLADQGYHPEILTDLDAVADRVAELSAAGRLRTLVGAGGDGTAGELANRTNLEVPLCLFPAGNENLLARHVGIRPSPEDVCRMIVDGQVRRFDAARAGGRLFLIMLGCGFDAEVCRRLEEKRSGPVGSLSYLGPIFRSVRKYKFPEIRVVDEAGSPIFDPPGRWLFVHNFPCYGGGFLTIPDANPTDGQLDLGNFQRGGLGSLFRYGIAVKRGKHERLRDFTTAKAVRFRIESDEQVPYQLDGDMGGYLPVEVELLPNRLPLLVPRTPEIERI